jgi:hypothetical protein
MWKKEVVSCLVDLFGRTEENSTQSVSHLTLQMRICNIRVNGCTSCLLLFLMMLVESLNCIEET